MVIGTVMPPAGTVPSMMIDGPEGEPTVSLLAQAPDSNWKYGTSVNEMLSSRLPSTPPAGEVARNWKVTRPLGPVYVVVPAMLFQTPSGASVLVAITVPPTII